jgi:chromate transporter
MRHGGTPLRDPAERVYGRGREDSCPGLSGRRRVRRSKKEDRTPMLWQLFTAFFKVGVLGYGGGPGSIGLIQDASRAFMSPQEFAEVLVVGQALPGPIATKLAFAVGLRAAGWFGALVALVGVVLPSIVLFLALYRLLTVYAKNSYVAGAIHATVPVVGAILLTLALDYIPWRTLAVGPWVVFVLSFVALRFLNVPMPYIILGSLALGALWRF